MIIFTNRLYITTFEGKDAKACFENWGKNIESGHPILGSSVANSNELVTSMKRFPGVICSNGIYTKDDVPVGVVAINELYKDQNVAEIGILIGKEYRRKGYAYEAVVGILSRLFTTGHYYIVEAKCNVDDFAVKDLLEKIGFQKEAYLRGRVKSDSQKREVILVYSITSEEFFKENEEETTFVSYTEPKPKKTSNLAVGYGRPTQTVKSGDIVVVPYFGKKPEGPGIKAKGTHIIVAGKNGGREKRLAVFYDERTHTLYMENNIYVKYKSRLIGKDLASLLFSTDNPQKSENPNNSKKITARMKTEKCSICGEYIRLFGDTGMCWECYKDNRETMFS
jgi:RimJ/RimL family protein N-acetyltransferase